MALYLSFTFYVAVTEWSGGLYVSPTVAGSRPGGLIAGAWAAMLSLGEEGENLFMYYGQHGIHICFCCFKSLVGGFHCFSVAF